MSRIGKKIITLPAGVTVSIDSNTNEVTVKGKLGELKETFLPFVKIEQSENEITLEVEDTSDKFKRAMWGTSRANLNNMVEGVSQGFTKELNLEGVGYKMNLKGNILEMALGFSHPVNVDVPDNVKLELNKNNLKGTSIDKQAVGQFMTYVHDLKPCEPYKHKGFKFPGRFYVKKVGKKAAAAAE